MHFTIQLVNARLLEDWKAKTWRFINHIQRAGCQGGCAIGCSEDTTIVTNPSAWPGLWANLVKDVIADPFTKNRVMVDLMNEPDALKLDWNNGVSTSTHHDSMTVPRVSKSQAGAYA